MQEPEEIEERQPRSRRALILFLLTCLSTFLVGFYRAPVYPSGIYLEIFEKLKAAHALWPRFLEGLTYSTCVMAVLGAHELGHYLQARRYGVPASLPYFIPFPISPFGTMGAVIVQQSGVADRKSMFDIAISGPLAGLVIALPLAYWGITHSYIEPLAAHQPVFANPPLLTWMIERIHGPLRPGTNLHLTPPLFAGWVGIFITALNLIPIGQLDGGHILYCLIRRRQHTVARTLFLLAAKRQSVWLDAWETENTSGGR